jgi:hypothetical protein
MSCARPTGTARAAFVAANDLQSRSAGGEVSYLSEPRIAAKVACYATDPDTNADDDEYRLFAVGLDHLHAKDL